MQESFHGNTKILGVIGHPIKHSFSPFIHNVTASLLKLDVIYLPFDVPASTLKDALRGMTALGIKGFNVTLPHKENIMMYLHQISEEAAVIGSINTVVNDVGKLYGYNTDVTGIIDTLKPYRDELAGETVTIIGGGGTARACVYSIIRHFKPGHINLVNRTVERIDTLVDHFKTSMKYEKFRTYELIQPDLVDLFRDSKLIINTTHVGMHPDEDDSVITIEKSFREGQIVFDAVYNPPETKLLKIAKSQGAVTLNGIKMLVSQGAKSFELWTGRQMPYEKVLDAITTYITS